jgi:hypothetical protein
MFPISTSVALHRNVAAEAATTRRLPFTAVSLTREVEDAGKCSGDGGADGAEDGKGRGGGGGRAAELGKLVSNGDPNGIVDGPTNTSHAGGALPAIACMSNQRQHHAHGPTSARARSSPKKGSRRRDHTPLPFVVARERLLVVPPA